MPKGDAARIRAHIVELADDARAEGETGITVRAGDIRESLEPDYGHAVIAICQVLGTRKSQGEAGVELVARRGPSHGLDSVFGDGRCRQSAGRLHGRRPPERQRPVEQRPRRRVELQAGRLPGPKEMALIPGKQGAGPQPAAGGGAALHRHCPAYRGDPDAHKSPMRKGRRPKPRPNAAKDGN